MRGNVTHHSAVDDYQLISQGMGIHLQHHTPLAMDVPYHVHPSIEINFLQGCDMAYSFGGYDVIVPRARFCVFWAAQPHRVSSVSGCGKITNAYITLEEFWSWPLPKDFVEVILAGGVTIATETLRGDNALMERLAREITNESEPMSRLHCLEMQTRITRLALTGWEVISPHRNTSEGVRIGGNAVVHFEKMLRYIATHYTEPITLGDVAGAASVSENYANTLFKKIIGTTVKAHITSVRVCRARMLLAETDAKIISIAMDSGFRSLSSFYSAFQHLVKESPAQFRDKISQRRL